MTAAGLRIWHVDAMGAAALAALTALGVALVVTPVLRTRMDHAALRSELASLRAKAAQLESARAGMAGEMDRLAERLAANRLKLHGPGYLNTRIAGILQTASTSGIVIDQTKSAPAARADLYEAVGIELAGTGSYPGCADFLHALHRQLPDTGLVAMELAGPSRGGDEGRFRFNLVWYSAAAAAGQEDAR